MLGVRHDVSGAGPLLCVLGLLLAASPPALAAEAPVVVTATSSVERIPVGESAEVTVTIEIAQGWHINARDPGPVFLIPTSVEFDLPAGARVGDVRYPEPLRRRIELGGGTDVALYEGTITIGARVHHDALSASVREAVAVLRYQACRADLCLRPAVVRVPLPLELSAVRGPLFAGVTDPPSRAAQASSPLDFEPFSAQAYDRARASGVPFVVEFRADWCKPCLEMEERTFTDPRVIREGRGMTFLTVDMTDPDRVTELILESFDVRGAPTTLFFDGRGKESTRRIGFVGPEDFARLLSIVRGDAAQPRRAPPPVGGNGVQGV